VEAKATRNSRDWLHTKDTKCTSENFGAQSVIISGCHASLGQTWAKSANFVGSTFIPTSRYKHHSKCIHMYIILFCWFCWWVWIFFKLTQFYYIIMNKIQDLLNSVAQYDSLSDLIRIIYKITGTTKFIFNFNFLFFRVILMNIIFHVY